MNDAKKRGAALVALTLDAAAATATAGPRGAGANDEAVAYGRTAAPAPLEETRGLQITPYDCQTGVPIVPARFTLLITCGAHGTLMQTTSNATFAPRQRAPGLGSWEGSGASVDARPAGRYAVAPMDSRRAASLLAAWLLHATPALLVAPASAAPAATTAPVMADTRAAAVPIGSPLREATLNGLNGPARRLSSFRGQPLIINVWASWCGPCRAEMASLERLAWHDVARHFTMIGISTDDYPDRAVAFMRRANATISHYIDRRLEMEHMLGASSIPLTVFVGADGRVLARVYGSREWDSPEQIRLIRRTFGLPPEPAGAGLDRARKSD